MSPETTGCSWLRAFIQISSSGHEEIYSLWNIFGLVHLCNDDYHKKLFPLVPTLLKKKKKEKRAKNKDYN